MTVILCHCAFAKKNDCFIYENVLVYLNVKEGEIIALYTTSKEGIEPTNIELTKEKVINKLALNFCIVNETSRFSENQLKEWFTKLLNDTTLVQIGFIENNTESIVNCKFNTIKYQYANFSETLSFVKANGQTEIQGTDTIHYNPCGIMFSNILYSKDERYAAVYVKVNRGMGFNYLYGFLFENSGGNWILKTVANETL